MLIGPGEPKGTDRRAVMYGAESDPDLVEQTRIVPYGGRNQFDTRPRVETLGDGGIDLDPPHAVFDHPRKYVKFMRTTPYIRFFGGPSLGRPIVELPNDRLGEAGPQRNPHNNGQL